MVAFNELVFQGQVEQIRRHQPVEPETVDGLASAVKVVAIVRMLQRIFPEAVSLKIEFYQEPISVGRLRPTDSN